MLFLDSHLPFGELSTLELCLKQCEKTPSRYALLKRRESGRACFLTRPVYLLDLDLPSASSAKGLSWGAVFVNIFSFDARDGFSSLSTVTLSKLHIVLSVPHRGNESACACLIATHLMRVKALEGLVVSVASPKLNCKQNNENIFRI